MGIQGYAEADRFPRGMQLWSRVPRRWSVTDVFLTVILATGFLVDCTSDPVEPLSTNASTVTSAQSADWDSADSGGRPFAHLLPAVQAAKDYGDGAPPIIPAPAPWKPQLDSSAAASAICQDADIGSLCPSTYPHGYDCPATSNPTVCVSSKALAHMGRKLVCCQ